MNVIEAVRLLRKCLPPAVVASVCIGAFFFSKPGQFQYSLLPSDKQYLNQELTAICEGLEIPSQCADRLWVGKFRWIVSTNIGSARSEGKIEAVLAARDWHKAGVDAYGQTVLCKPPYGASYKRNADRSVLISLFTGEERCVRRSK